ncbi:MAG: hypothetical protein R6W77_13730 [Trueperaceae bacterium]
MLAHTKTYTNDKEGFRKSVLQHAATRALGATVLAILVGSIALAASSMVMLDAGPTWTRTETAIVAPVKLHEAGHHGAFDLALDPGPTWTRPDVANPALPVRLVVDYPADCEMTVDAGECVETAMLVVARAAIDPALPMTCGCTGEIGSAWCCP